MKRQFRNILGFCVIAITATIFAGCRKNEIYASQEIMQEMGVLSNETTTISIESGIDLILDDNIELGRITIEANENIHSYIDTDIKDEKIHFSLDDRVSQDEVLIIRIFVNPKQFTTFQASGGSTILIHERLRRDDIYFTLSGGAGLDANIESENLYLTLSGSSRAYLSGTTTMLHVTSSSGGSDIDALEMLSQGVNFNLSGGSLLRVYLANNLSGVATGESKIEYRSENINLDIKAELSGGSKLDKIE